jgi:hypothetical protein
MIRLHNKIDPKVFTLLSVFLVLGKARSNAELATRANIPIASIIKTT